MARPLIAVTDSPFPSLDPAKAALARVDPELRMAKSASADDILAVARDADAILVTYAKLPGELLAPAHALQGDRPLRPRRRQYRRPGGERARHHRHLCARLLPAGSVRPRDGAAAGAGAQGAALQQAGAVRPLGGAADRADPPAERAVLGLVGFGNIPRALAPKAKAFGLRVVTHDPYVSPDVLAERRRRRRRASTSCWRMSDFISMHAPLMPATRGLFNARRLSPR